MNGERVRLFIRIEDHPEICIGYARTIRDVPVLLERVATTLRDGIEPDVFEPGMPGTGEPHR